MGRYLIKTRMRVLQAQSLAQLAKLAKMGVVGRDDVVKELPNGPWIRADTHPDIGRLYRESDSERTVVAALSPKLLRRVLEDAGSGPGSAAEAPSETTQIFWVRTDVSTVEARGPQVLERLCELGVLREHHGVSTSPAGPFQPLGGHPDHGSLFARDPEDLSLSPQSVRVQSGIEEHSHPSSRVEAVAESVSQEGAWSAASSSGERLPSSTTTAVRHVRPASRESAAVQVERHAAHRGLPAHVQGASQRAARSADSSDQRAISSAGQRKVADLVGFGVRGRVSEDERRAMTSGAEHLVDQMSIQESARREQADNKATQPIPVRSSSSAANRAATAEAEGDFSESARTLVGVSASPILRSGPSAFLGQRRPEISVVITLGEDEIEYLQGGDEGREVSNVILLSAGDLQVISDDELFLDLDDEGHDEIIVLGADDILEFEELAAIQPTSTRGAPWQDFRDAVQRVSQRLAEVEPHEELTWNLFRSMMEKPNTASVHGPSESSWRRFQARMEIATGEPSVTPIPSSTPWDDFRQLMARPGPGATTTWDRFVVAIQTRRLRQHNRRRLRATPTVGAAVSGEAHIKSGVVRFREEPKGPKVQVDDFKEQ